LSDTFGEVEVADGSDVTRGLRRGADAAYQAVLRPVEGTMLTVVRCAAEAAEAAAGGGDATLVAVLESASSGAVDAVARTPDLLPVLRDAGVVDAGGRGLALLLDAFLAVVDGRTLPEPELVATPAVVVSHLERGDPSDLRYEVMYLLHAPDDTIAAFKDAWAALGDSIVVVGGDGLWNCHVHTNEIGAAVEAGIQAGRPVDIRVTDLQEQVEEEQWVREHTAPGTIAAPDDRDATAEPATTAVVAVAVGEGLRRLLTSLGVHEIVAGGQSMNPSTAQILEAVERCRPENVVVLPDNKNIVPVARQVDGLTAKHVAVVPTTSVIEALAALITFDPDADLDANVEVMGTAASHVRTGEVTQAVRDSVAECGPITAGDWIALTRDGVCATSRSSADAAIALVGYLVDDASELITVLVGSGAVAADTTRLEENLALAFPSVDVEVHEGGQPLYPYLIGVE
jgi:DAK2 domain fusion protein YloV